MTASGLRPPRSRIRTPCLVLVLAVVATARAGAQTILNTERLQPRDVSGAFLRIEASFDLLRGNSHVSSVSGNEAVGYRGARHWIVLMGGLSRLSSDGRVSVDDRYGQLRYGYILSERTHTFHFAQLQSSRSQLLKRRLLLGSGARTALVHSDANRVEVGVGLMWEDERLDAPRLPPGYRASGRDVRGDLLGVAEQRISATSTLSNVVYVEPRVDAPADSRILEEARLTAKVVDGVDLSVAVSWRYDSRPPPSVRPNDVQIRTSLAALVR